MYHTLAKKASGHLVPFLELLRTLFSLEARNIFLWFPVFTGVGIGLYFSLPEEPSLWFSSAFFTASSLVYLIFRKQKAFKAFLPTLLFFISLGFGAAHLRTLSLNTFLLNYPTSSQDFTGTVDKIEKKPKGIRLTLSHVTAQKTKFRHPLPKVRITLRGKSAESARVPRVGDLVSIKAVLLPPSGPVAPYAYDFRRKAYFDGLSAIGYATGPLTILQQSSQQDVSHRIEAVRETLTNHLSTLIGGREGGIAAALVTGDRSGIDDALRDAYANSGIAHILAISGLHLSIVAGLIFLLIRRGLCFIPPLALRLNTKKIAAGASVFFTFLYLTLADFALPAQRAFIMTSMIMLAILTDRTALTLRNVALAALVILLLLPESLLSASFQLSFSAVIALVAGYEALRAPLGRWVSRDNNFLRKGVLYIGGICLSTLLATAATTPLIIYTFNRFTLHALEANLISIPLLSFVIMPLLLLFFFLSLFGMEGWTAPLLKGAVGLMTRVAESVSSWEGSAIGVSQMSAETLCLFVFGGLLLCFFKTRLRGLGGGLLILFLFHLSFPRNPEYFVSEDGKLFAKIEPSGEGVVNSLRSARFARETWQKMFAIEAPKKDPSLVLPLDAGVPRNEGGVFLYPDGRLLTTKDFTGHRPWSVSFPKLR